MGGQGQSGENPGQKAAESLLAFWAAAGVDTCYGEDAVNRLAQAPKPLRAAVAPAPEPKPGAGPVVDISAAVAEAKALADAAPDLEALAAAIAAFDGCPLKFSGARQAVFSRGNPEAPVMVIGEGPGADEDLQGSPFVGRAGKLLDRMLAAASLSHRVFVTNTVFWRPPGNRTPTFAEQAICAPFLERAISLVNPRFLLLVGGASAKAILKKDEGILSLRGRWFEWESSERNLIVPALPTLHPAFLLRQPAAKKKTWSDLLTLAERLDRPVRTG